MKVIVDSNVFISASVKNHPKHERISLWLANARQKKTQLYTSAHSLLEVYSVLTRAPFKPPFSPKIASDVIEKNIVSHFKIIDLSANESLEIMVAKNLRGGIIYDAVLVKCAQKLKIQNIATLNPKHFTKLVPADSYNIITF